MIKIKIVSGTYGYNNGFSVEPKNKDSDPFEIPDAEAKRLVSLGFAEFVIKGEQAAEVEENNFHVETPSDEKNNIEGHLDAEQMEKMTNADLKKLAEDMGIDTSKMKKKSDYIEAIVSEQVFISEDDAIEEGLEIGTEDPVV